MQAPLQMMGYGQGQEQAQPYLSQYMQPFTQNPFAAYIKGQGLLKTAMGMPYTERADVPGMAGPELGTLLQYGLGQQLGPGAKWLAGRVPYEYAGWQGEYPGFQAGGAEPSFLKYLSTKYNLGQYL